MDAWQQEVARILDPALFGIRDDEHLGKLDHLVEQAEQLVLHLNKHAHVCAGHLLQVGCLGTLCILGQKEAGW